MSMEFCAQKCYKPQLNINMDLLLGTHIWCLDSVLKTNNCIHTMPNSLNSHFVSYEETFNQNNVQIYELLKLLSYFESFFFKVVD